MYSKPMLRSWFELRWIVLFSILLCLALLALRYGVIENGLLPRDGIASWLLVQSFHEQRIGIIALVFGALGFLMGWKTCGKIGWFVGLAGWILYSPDYAVPGTLLGLFTILRAQVPPHRRACSDSPCAKT